jgi:formyltetrahydrofolate synthetase
MLPMGRLAKLDFLKIINRLKDKPDGKYIEVTAITPTPLGEGKSTTSCGLMEGLGKRGVNVGGALRQPSGGPTMNVKGTAAGGGNSLLIPMTEFSLGLTGDINDIMNAHNLAMVAMTSRMQHERNYNDEQLARLTGMRRLDIDPTRVEMGWIIDFCAQSLRNIIIGLGGRYDGFTMQSKFGIAVGSECMAILAVVRDLADLQRTPQQHHRGLRQERQTGHHRRPGSRQRHDRLHAQHHQPDHDVHRRVQPLHGARRTVRQHRRGSELHHRRPRRPEAVRLPRHRVRLRGRHRLREVLERQVPLQRPETPRLGSDLHHPRPEDARRRPRRRAGKAMDEEYTKENLELVEKGCENMVHMIGVIRKAGINPVVCINRFYTDTDAECAIVRKAAEAAGARCAESKHWEKGGDGALEFADAVIDACNEEPTTSSSSIRWR